MGIWKPVIFLFFLHYDQFVVTHPLDQQSQLFEGSQCRLPDGSGIGICVKAIDCPLRVEQIFGGNYSAAGRCGFDRFDEIYCCPLPPLPRSVDEFTIRPAEIACRSYKKTFKELENDGYVHTSVIGGIQARAGEFPHMAALRYPISEGEEAAGLEYACGGTLISLKHVLTAAHCVSNVQGLVPVEVVLGATDLSKTRSPGRQRVSITKIIKFPEYKRGLNYHDLAILELETRVEFTRDVHPTCLMTESLSRYSVNPRASLVVLGWGATDLDGTISMKLLKAERLKFVTKQSCAKRYRYSLANIPDGLDEAMICVKDPDTTRMADTCWGDSGGPLLISSPVFPRLIGVTSFGQACGGFTPGVYAAVYRYLNWIEDQVWPDSD